MCNKVLVKLIHHLNSKNCSNQFCKYAHTSSVGAKSFDLSNLNAVLMTTRSKPYLRQSGAFSNSVLLNSNGFRNSSHVSVTSVLSPSFCRTYSTDNQPKLPKIMHFPEVVWPSVFKTIRNWVLSNFIIMRYFDNEFNLPDFVNGSKQAVEIVSGHISRGDIDSLTGLVTPEVIEQVKESLEVFTLKQRQDFGIKQDDIFFSFPYEVGVMFPNEDKQEVDGENQSRFVEITMCYHAMKGLKEHREQGMQTHMNMGAMPEHYDKIFICNYRFIREFTKGVQDGWTINAINHFKPQLSVG